MPKISEAKAQAKADKRKELAQRVLAPNEPIIDPENYISSFSSALNWYSYSVDSKKRKEWTLSFLKKRKRLQEVEALKDRKDFEFHSLGAICRLIDREQPLSEEHVAFIDTRIAVLLEDTVHHSNITVTPTKVKADVPVPTIQDRILEKAREIGADIDGEIDDFVTAGCPKEYKFRTGVRGLGTPVIKHLVNFYKPELAELKEALEGEDEQLVEGYSNFKTIQLKRFVALLDSLIRELEQQLVLSKTVRKPRARKEKPASVLVAKVKYKTEDSDLAVKSVHPTEIIKKDELWVFNTKYRKLTVYRAVEGSVLSVKGTTILNYDTERSQSKTLRKPELILSKLSSLTKRSFNAEFKAVKSKASKPNGRINEDTLLLKAFI